MKRTGVKYSITTEPKIYDDGAFTIDKGNWGYQSFDREGNKLILSLSEWECEFCCPKYLMAQQEGWPESMSRVMNDGKVGGKL